MHANQDGRDVGGYEKRKEGPKGETRKERKRQKRESMYSHESKSNIIKR